MYSGEQKVFWSLLISCCVLEFGSMHGTCEQTRKKNMLLLLAQLLEEVLLLHIVDVCLHVSLAVVLVVHAYVMRLQETARNPLS